MKKINWIAVLYFLTGFLLSWSGLIVGGLLIKFREKTQKPLKVKSLLGGFALAFLFSLVVYPYVIEPQVERVLYKKYSEAGAVYNAVKAQYPDGKVHIGLSWKKSYNSRYGSSSTSMMSVTYESKNELTVFDLENIGKIACITLQNTGKMYDYIGVANQMPLFQITGISIGSKHTGVGATCDMFLNPDNSSR